MNLKGTKTEKNLMEAFAGESQARNKYTFYASKAKKDGYVQIANIFEQTANNEKAVSYTHLDVYKRQAFQRSSFGKQMGRAVCLASIRAPSKAGWAAPTSNGAICRS